MKNASIKIGIVTLVLLLASGLDGWAHTPRSREISGIIQEVNVEKRMFTVEATEDGKVMKLVWTRDTKFVQDQRVVDSPALKTGLKVCVDYRAPFFGKPYATKVAWGEDQRR